MRVIIYEPAGGEILRVVDCPEGMLEIQAQPGESALVGDADDLSHYVAGGELVLYAPDEAAAKASRPAWAAGWSNTAMGWIDPRTLADLKAAKWAEIKTARAAAIDAPLVTPYGTFDSDAVGRSNIADSVLLAQSLAARGLPSDIEFTLEDNTSVTLTAEQMTTVGLLLGAKVNAAHAQSRALRPLIENATAATLDGITWT
jgi:hypothetical protein